MDESQSEATGAQVRSPPNVCHGQDFHATSSASTLHSEKNGGVAGTGLVGMRGAIHYKVLIQCLPYSRHSINVLRT